MLWGSKFEVNGRLVVISGGSQGVGAELGKQLFSKGADVVLVARTVEKLEEVTKEIEKVRVNAEQKVSYISSDISEYAGCEKVFDQLERSPDIVVCCAGSSLPKLFTDFTGEELEYMTKVNYFTALYFSNVAVKKMCKIQPVPRQPRHLIYFSSVCGLYSFIGYGAYGPAKVAIRTLSDVVRQEVLPYNIKVSCVYPGNFMSPGYLEEERTKPEITREIEGLSEPISVELTVQRILRSLDKGYETITTDFIGWVLTSLSLGSSPRSLWFLQIIMSFLFSLIAPLWSYMIVLQIKSFFKKRHVEAKVEEVEEEEEEEST